MLTVYEALSGRLSGEDLHLSGTRPGMMEHPRAGYHIILRIYEEIDETGEEPSVLKQYFMHITLSTY